MKTRSLFRILVILVPLICADYTHAQNVKTCSWNAYGIKFKVPAGFRIVDSTTEVWKGTDEKITLDLFLHNELKLSCRDLQEIVYNWAVDSSLENIGKATNLDETQLNGYCGVMYLGDKNDNPVAIMVLLDPDHPGLSLYIWVSYTEGCERPVQDMLLSFAPL